MEGANVEFWVESECDCEEIGKTHSWQDRVYCERDTYRLASDAEVLAAAATLPGAEERREAEEALMAWLPDTFGPWLAEGTVKTVLKALSLPVIEEDTE